MYKIIFKRVLDFCLTFIFFIGFIPFFLTLVIFLAIVNKGNPFFIQKRPGKNEKMFNIIKFKTMNDKRDNLGNLLPDDKRLTKIGSLVRKSSLDEIPQLLNVLKGDMSLIGPRPLLPEYLSYYTKFQQKRHNVRPGITGWAQVNGRNAISWEEKFEYDVWYVENVSFWLDLKILIYTFKKVFKVSEISADQHVTMPRFDRKDEQ